MDPDANLNEQLELSRGFINDLGDYSADDVLRLADLVLAMNQWITKGGFLPAIWRQTHRPKPKGGAQ